MELGAAAGGTKEHRGVALGAAGPGRKDATIRILGAESGEEGVVLHNSTNRVRS
jgi:hypothetical protein